jgi:hypothetical protein
MMLIKATLMNIGLENFLWEMGFKSFIYRYRGLSDNSLKNLLGNYPNMSLDEALWNYSA